MEELSTWEITCAFSLHTGCTSQRDKKATTRGNCAESALLPEAALGLEAAAAPAACSATCSAECVSSSWCAGEQPQLTRNFTTRTCPCAAARCSADSFRAL